MGLDQSKLYPAINEMVRHYGDILLKYFGNETDDSVNINNRELSTLVAGTDYMLLKFLSQNRRDNKLTVKETERHLVDMVTSTLKASVEEEEEEEEKKISTPPHS